MRRDAAVSYKPFHTPEELAQLQSSDLILVLSERFEDSGGTQQQSGVQLRLTPPPLPLTAILGRDAEITGVTELISSGARLVTVTGMGGLGKTRLVAEVARRLVSSMPDSVHFVGLSAVRSSDAALPDIAESLGIPHERDRTAVESLADHIGDRHLVLVLDNFERVTAAAPQLASLLDACPGVQAMVTSQHTLGIRGEREFPLDPLPVPSGSAPADAAVSPAVQLFAERAAEVQPGFALTADNVATIIEICRRLDGLPLAIELAAARVRLLQPAALLRRLERRLDLLATDAAGVPERQRTLRATIDWSYHLLTPDEQRFGRLSVFTGGCTLEAAERVCGDGVDVVSTATSLLEKSLLLVADSGSGDEPRLRLLDTVREYALERLYSRPDAAHLYQRHAQYFLQLVTDGEALSRGPAHGRWFERLDAEAGNLRATAEWLIAQGDWNGVSEFGWCPAIYYWIRGNVQQLRGWIERAYPHQDSLTAPNRGHLLAYLASASFLGGDSARAERLADEALSVLEPSDNRATVLALQMRVLTIFQKGRLDEGTGQAAEMLARAHASGDPWNIMLAGHLGSVAARLRGDLILAENRLTESLAIARQLGQSPFIGICLRDLGLLRILRDDPAGAQPLLLDAGDSFRRAHFREGLADCLETLTAVALAAGDARLAARALASAEGTRQYLGVPHWTANEPLNERLHSQLRAQLGSDLDAEWAAGASMNAYAAFDEVAAALRSRA